MLTKQMLVHMRQEAQEFQRQKLASCTVKIDLYDSRFSSKNRLKVLQALINE